MTASIYIKTRKVTYGNFFFFFPGAVGHHGDNLAEKVLSVLPKLPGHANDVMVNMVELTALQTPDDSCSIIAPGCLAQPK